MCNKEKKTLSVIFLKLNLSTKEGENRGLKSIAEKRGREEKKKKLLSAIIIFTMLSLAYHEFKRGGGE